MPLTEIQIKNAKPQDKPYKLTDGNGLYLLISPKGKYWRYDYRIYGKRKTLAIGIYPVTTLANAREKHLAARRLLAQEPPIDPSEYKRQQRTEQKKVIENAFENVAREWLTYYRPAVNSTHHDRTMRRLEVYLFPWIGKAEISTLTPPDILKPLKLIQEQNKLETAHRVLQVTSQIFRYAVRTGRAGRDITADLRGAIPSARIRHMASMTEPEDVAQLMKAINGFKGSLTVQIALKLAPLVFVRPGELRRARWADIDLEAKEWRYMVTKTKTEHLVPLSTQAVELLKTIHPTSGHGEWVFRGGHDPRKPMSEAAINAALKRMGYDTQKDITGHGFRAMARTILHERLNFDPYVIEHQLAHKVPDALGAAYNRTKFIEQRKTMMQLWANYLSEIFDL